MGIKFRLIAMNFLQYAIWGSWLISLGAYLGGGLDFSGLQIGSFFATMGIASLFMPAVMGLSPTAGFRRRNCWASAISSAARFSSPRPRRRLTPRCTAACC